MNWGNDLMCSNLVNFVCWEQRAWIRTHQEDWSFLGQLVINYLLMPLVLVRAGWWWIYLVVVFVSPHQQQGQISTTNTLHLNGIPEHRGRGPQPPKKNRPPSISRLVLAVGAVDRISGGPLAAVSPVQGDRAFRFGVIVSIAWPCRPTVWNRTAKKQHKI